MRIEKIQLDQIRNTELTVYLQEESVELAAIKKRPGMLIFPGGGYEFCSDREAEPIALQFLAEGYQTFVLRYSVGKFKNFEQAFLEAEQALALMHKQADSWHLDTEKIGVIGFSAGGHLAAALANLGRIRPSAAILGYATLLPTMAAQMGIQAPNLLAAITPKTPPTFLFATDEDSLVPIENTILYQKELAANTVPFEAHIFQKGGHGLSLGKPVTANGTGFPNESPWRLNMQSGGAYVLLG